MRFIPDSKELKEALNATALVTQAEMNLLTGNYWAIPQHDEAINDILYFDGVVRGATHVIEPTQPRI